MRIRFNKAIVWWLLASPSAAMSIVHKRCLPFSLNCRQCLLYGCTWGQSQEGSPACAAFHSDFVSGWRVLLSPGSEEFCPSPFQLCHGLTPASTPPCAPCVERSTITLVASIMSIIFTVLAIGFFLFRKRDDIRRICGSIRKRCSSMGSAIQRRCRHNAEPPKTNVDVELPRGRPRVKPPTPHPVIIASDSDEYADAVPGPSSAVQSPRRSERIRNQTRSINPFSFYGTE